ncbi:MAG: hypothetical protein K9N06_00120 [Candidatus Cloacimonetes bacterium]|nr:hypothetical protein [Candidatus Cloacimonadota bacterium]
MSNKMRKLIFILLFWQVAILLEGFVPERRDFASEYQYCMFRSWSALEKSEKELPARITYEQIERMVQFTAGETQVVYIWENWKIYRQLENLPDMLPFSGYQKELTIAGELLYRLNCRHTIFAEHYLKKMPITLQYENLTGDNALNSLRAHYPNQRLPLLNIHPVIDKDRLVQLKLVLDNDDEISLTFSESEDLAQDVLGLKKFEWEFPEPKLPDDFLITEKVITKTGEPVLDIPELEEMIQENPYKEYIQSPADSLLTSYENKLIRWIEMHQNTMWGSEMINNKVSDISSFLQTEFPYHSLLIRGDVYNLTHVPFGGNLSADLYLKAKENGGWSITACDDIVIDRKQVTVDGFEKFDLSALTDYEAESICQYLPQLLISHRVIGSRLQGFILQPDMIETTLVFSGSQRRIYNIRSYHDLLLLLGNFWKDRIIYYTVNDFKVIDGYIEFRGYLSAEDPKNGFYDLAEIRYRLDEDYMMVLAMMVIYPEQQQVEMKGR